MSTSNPYIFNEQKIAAPRKEIAEAKDISLLPTVGEKSAEAHEMIFNFMQDRIEDQNTDVPEEIIDELIERAPLVDEDSIKEALVNTFHLCDQLGLPVAKVIAEASTQWIAER